MLLVPSTRLRADRFKNIYVCDWIIRAWTVESEAGAVSLPVLVVDPRLFRASVVPLDRLTVRLWLTWQVVRTPRSDVTVFQPQPRIPCPSICLVQQRGFIVADISRSVCPFLSAAPCRGSVAGRRRPGGFDLQKSWYRWKREAWTFSRPAWTSDPLAAFLVMRHPALWRFRSPAGFHRSRPQQQQLVSLISPAPSVLCLNVHKNSCCRVWWRLGLEFVWLKVRTRRKTVQESIVGL